MKSLAIPSRIPAAKLLTLFVVLASSLTAQQLSWAPPALSNPITLSVSNTNRSLTLTAGQDYIIQFPSTAITVKGGISISGGRHVVIIGGEVRHDTDFGGDWGVDQRGLYVKNWTGTFHIEGLLIRGTKLGEGIDVDTRTVGAILQVQNVRVDRVHGSQATNHADVIQNWGGPTYYRIDRLTGYTNYQGLMMQPTQFGNPTELADFRNMNLSGFDGLGKYMIFRTTSGTNDYQLTNVWHNPGDPSGGTKGAYPHNDPEWNAINMGVPPGGDFVPASIVGVNYVSPGYVGQGTVATPAFNPAGGSYTSAQSVTITTATSGATIRYTTDGSTPSPTVGTIYSSPVSVSVTTTLKAIAYKSGMTNSAVATATYTIAPPGSVVATAPASAGSQFVNNAMTTQAGTFTVTYNATPTANAMDGCVALSLGAQTTFTGLATLVRFNTSGNIDARNGGAFAADATIPYSANQSYAFRLVVNVPAHTYSIYVTPPGSSEQTVGANYGFRTEQNTVTSLNNWAAVATNPPGGASIIVSNFAAASASPVAAPTFSPGGGTYFAAQSVTIASATTGATIRYTTDGSNPSATVGTIYSGPVTISTSKTLKAIAYKSGMPDSSITSANYVIQSINETFSTSPAANFTVVSGGTWTVTGGQYVLTNPAQGTPTGGNANISVHNTALSGNWTLTVDGSTTATTSAWNDFTVMFGYQNATNYYYVSFNESNDANTSGIFKIANNVKTELVDITSLITAGTTYAVKVIKSGSTYQVFRNNVLVATATDSTWASGKVGFGTSNDGATYDNLVVTPQ